ncbi:hypothetical protein HF086_017645 [Spodoptera exigua]|uniref:Uncharacterized protein n=1 Tax=Spodoptera exigua TaxID=7107 RepID=A0A922MEV5_SPOEX|nr:hypothetical protein HF086_017645 [Spodoptera exigua]
MVCVRSRRGRVRRGAPCRGRYQAAPRIASHCTHCTALHDHTPAPAPAPALRAAASVGRVRLARAADLTQPLTPTYGSQCGNQEFIF